MIVRSAFVLAGSLGVCALAATALAQSAGPARSAPLEIGAPMPSTDVRMRGVLGRMVTIERVVGRLGTLVVFTCNHCPYAQAWESRLVELGNTYRARGFGVIAINPNDPVRFPADAMAPMQARARRAGMRFPYVVDSTSDVARAYGATRTPEVFLFDGNRRLAYRGAIDDNAYEPDAVQHRYLRDAFDALIAGRAPTPAETRSIGCTIKFREARP